MNDDDKIKGRLHGEQHEPDKREGMAARLLHMIIIWFLLSIAQTLLTVMTLVQFVLMLINNNQPNARLAEAGTDLGIWIAKAARYQTGASEVKPWPWTELD